MFMTKKRQRILAGRGPGCAPPIHNYGITNASFAASDQQFRAACDAAKIPPTKRQASKWRMGRGLAFAKRRAVTA